MKSDTRPGCQRLRDWRKAAGLSQQDAADRLGVRQATWCEWESADVRRGPHRDLAVRIEALTDGAVPIESWSGDPQVAEDMLRVVRNRASDPLPPVDQPPNPVDHARETRGQDDHVVRRAAGE